MLQLPAQPRVCPRAASHNHKGCAWDVAVTRVSDAATGPNERAPKPPLLGAVLRPARNRCTSEATPQLQPATRPALACREPPAPGGSEHTATNRPPRCFCRRMRAAARSRCALARATGYGSGWVGRLAWSGSRTVAAWPCVAMRLAPKLLPLASASAASLSSYGAAPRVCGAAVRSFTWPRASAAAARWMGRCRAAAWAAWKPSCVANRSVSACYSTVEARRCRESLARRLWPLPVTQALAQPSQ